MTGVCYLFIESISDYPNFTNEMLIKRRHSKYVKIIDQKNLEINGLVAVNLISFASDIKSKEVRSRHFKNIYTDDSNYINQSKCDLKDRNLTK
jgi:hypothetical protein